MRTGVVLLITVLGAGAVGGLAYWHQSPPNQPRRRRPNNRKQRRWSRARSRTGRFRSI